MENSISCEKSCELLEAEIPVYFRKDRESYISVSIRGGSIGVDSDENFRRFPEVLGTSTEETRSVSRDMTRSCVSEQRQTAMAWHLIQGTVN